MANANTAAQKMIDEARESASHVAERKQQEAVRSSRTDRGREARERPSSSVIAPRHS
jgi:cell division septum initiation protein DivIVA